MNSISNFNKSTFSFVDHIPDYKSRLLIVFDRFQFLIKFTEVDFFHKKSIQSEICDFLQQQHLT